MGSTLGKAQSSCVLSADGVGFVALTSLRIPQNQKAEEQALALKIVIDCSGSMAGTSIAQARKASLEILNLLRPKDYFNVTLFGDSHVHFFPKMAQANAKNITTAWNGLEKLGADLGGTEMGKALESTFSLSGCDAKETILLITDGEIHEHEKLVKRAKQSGHRIFTVGVGNAVAEVFLKSLSSETGGACELVAPQEGMTERVLSQFHRMRQPKLGLIKLDWPSKPDWQTALPKAVFAGDTVQVFAGFKNAVEGDVTLKVYDDVDVTSTIKVVSETQIPRLSAARRMGLSDEVDGLQLALRYQLLSRWTNFIVIAERAENANDLPEIHQVPQMLAADWGGAGAVFRRVVADVKFLELDSPCVLRTARHHSASVYPKSVEATFRVNHVDAPNMTLLNNNLDVTYASEFVKNIEEKHSRFLRKIKLPISIVELVDLGLDSESASELRRFITSGGNEIEVVATFIYALSESCLGDIFGHSFKRVVFKYWKDCSNNAPLFEQMMNSIIVVSNGRRVDMDIPSFLRKQAD